MKFSLIIPVFNEDGNISRLLEECLSSLPEELLGEIIVVDDCSQDDSVKQIMIAKETSEKIRLIRHRSNAGQSAALRTGIMAARFDIIGQLDGDRQNDPVDLPRLIARLDKPGGEGPALISGIRIKRQDTGSKRLASRAANKIRDWVLHDNCPDTGCGVKVYWRDAYLRLPFFTSIHRFLPTLFQTYGYKCEYVPVNDRPRISGVSKYNNFGRAIIGFFDLLGVLWLRRRIRFPETEEL